MELFSFIFKASSSRLFSIISSLGSPQLLMLAFIALLKPAISDVDRDVRPFNVWTALEPAEVVLAGRAEGSHLRSIKARNIVIIQVKE